MAPSTVAFDGSEHLDYVPTQIVTEYLRLIYRLRERDNPPLNGLIFTSSKTGGQNFALFVPNADCLDQDEHPETAGLHLPATLTGLPVSRPRP